MSIIDFNSAIWSDPWFRQLSSNCKILFVYLWTNNHKNLAGLYSIDIDTIAFESGLTKKQATDSLKTLFPKILYDFDKNVVWVVNHVRHQFLRTGKVSPKIVQGIHKCLNLLNKHSLITNFLNEYNEILNIPYAYPIEGVYIYPSSEGEGEGKGEGGGKEDLITCDEIVQGWNTICAVKGFPKVSTLTPDRRSKVNTRLRTHKEVEFWNKVFNKIVQTPFLMGKNDMKWKPTFDWLFKNDENSIKIYEGNYEKER